MSSPVSYFQVLLAHPCIQAWELAFCKHWAAHFGHWTVHRQGAAGHQDATAKPITNPLEYL